jgi:flagellar motility protein MotE (MotC chaperone)
MTVRKKKQGRFAGRGVLVILALLFASSGALRLGSGVGAAMARAPETSGTEDAPGAPLQCPAPPLAVAEALTARKTRLAAQEAALADRIAALALTEEAVSARLAELSAAEASLKATIDVADGAAEKDLARLTTVYEAMKPADTAKLFAAMAPDFAAGFIGRMRPEAAAAVMAGMTPETAYQISAMIAGRSALAPKE